MQVPFSFLKVIQKPISVDNVRVQTAYFIPVWKSKAKTNKSPSSVFVQPGVWRVHKVLPYHQKQSKAVCELASQGHHCWSGDESYTAKGALSLSLSMSMILLFQ